MVYWITGRKGAGKTTLARKLAAQIPNSVVLDGDEQRKLDKNDDYSDYGRLMNQLSLTLSARQCERSGQTAIIACVSPNKRVRQLLQGFFSQCVEIQLYHGSLWEGSTYEE